MVLGGHYTCRDTSQSQCRHVYECFLQTCESRGKKEQLQLELELLLPGVVLWPNIPLKKQGIRMLPPMSEPMPITAPAAPSILPSPPEKEEINRETEELEEVS